MKNRLFDNRVTANLSAFYYRYTNEANPVLGPINPTGYAYVVTPARSHVMGIEGEFAWKFTANDTIGGNVLLQKSKYDAYTAPGIPFLGIPTVVYTGQRRAFSPTWSGSTTYEHVFNLTASSQLTFTADMNFQSDSIVLAPAGYTQPAYVKGNTSLTYTFADRKYLIGAYINNITDKFVAPYATISATSGNTFVQGEPPRTYGIKLGGRF
jgi:iron complex outermembrane receptor protein